MKYFVTGNLRHNGARYKRGDTVELNDEAASPLLAINAITSDAQPQEPVAPEPEIERKPEPIVGGEATSTGEPSIDGAAEAVRAEATDITPPVAPEPEIDPSAGL